MEVRSLTTGTATRRRILSVSIHDCEVQHFRSGGKGGQNQNKRDTGARIIHHPSGARGESREERSQLQNKKRAFLRMIETPEFKLWMRLETGRIAHTEAQLGDIQIQDHEVKVEIKRNGRWEEVRGL
jgi:protein subunit release factor B